ncbi:MAG TPA: hypothetical protein VGN16_02985 [Acidobacteriaceae bacterium]|jgi:hypothetical protein
MPKSLPKSDFRSRRRILLKSDFAFAEGPEPAPSDKIDVGVWQSVVTLPDDVSVRTSNHQGKKLKQLEELNTAWLYAMRMPPYRERMSQVMLDVHDEMSASLYNCLVGYYRFSAGGMRNVLELSTIGCWAQVCGTKQEFRDWQKGKIELSLGKACDGLISGASSLEAHLKATVNDTLFAQKNSKTTGLTAQGGYVRRIFSGISNFAHSRPKHTNADTWESNGPIYVESAFNHIASIHFETIAIAYVLVLLARPKMRISPVMRKLFADTDRVKTRVTRAAFIHLS